MTTPSTPPMLPTNPAPRKTPVPHLDTLRGQIKFAIPITSTDMATIQKANELLSAAVKVLADGHAYAKAEASLGRVQSTLIPVRGTV